MNSTITFTDKKLFLSAVTALELDATPAYALDLDNLTILCEDAYSIAAILRDNDIFNFHWSGADENEPDQFLTDAEADADALASAGMGTDEDYHLDTISGEEW